ncbi:MAG TPA: hypothetical protein PLC07_05290 [Bacillota bacterium]|nr:hypothetical protein [Bacillota bacterium]HPT86303.1 hypothetical protein [Bacillota bacterium]
MPFTFSQTNLNNDLETYDLAISINPTNAIINQTIEAGDVVVGSIGVANTGQVNADVYLTADWGPASGTTDREATLLANALTVSVFLSEDPAPTQQYIGSFIGLIDQRVITGLTPASDTQINISVGLPGTRSGPTLLGKAINTDFVFIAVSVE